MATKDEVVSAITHIMNNQHNDQWRGKLNDYEYQQLKALYEDSTPGSTWVPDTLIGSLRNQWPALFDPKTGAEVNPREAAESPSTSPAGSMGSGGSQPQPTPAGQGTPGGTEQGAGSDQMSGKAADTIKQLDEALKKNHSAINDADVQLSDAILSAKTSDAQSKSTLDGLKQSVIDQVTKIGPEAMKTRAGMEELATYLDSKTKEILNVVKTANLDSESQSKILDALTARYTALGKNAQGSQPGGTADNPQDPGGVSPQGSGGGGATPADPGGGGGLPPDPLLSGGLPSDPFMSGIGQALGPALGAAAGIPAQMAGMIPGVGGGGGGLGDLGSTIGSALRDSGAGRDGADDKPGDQLRDQHAGTQDNNKPGTGPDGKPLTDQNQGPGADQNHTQQTGNNGQPVAGPAAPAGPDLTVKIEGLGEVKAPNGPLASAAREIVNGGNVHDAYNRFNIALPPPGTPVTAPISPGNTVFGDVGQYNDHQIMALGDRKAWVNGKVVSLDQIEQGTNFLGWIHPTVPVPATAAPVTAAPPVMAAAAPAAPSPGFTVSTALPNVDIK
ncbi:DUF4226 domain-containing protein [Mycobacteroides abscessus]|uniref:DUF4226 domain-containing protein n=1 Tax=Mycobacteroides abscessus TaxID=36809 RepID=UPI00092B422C|nr:DUF4226 domain-containing protein [Mycobacteroides abscessus]SIK91880.1 Biofilm regulator BssS [Mycobacteroides abscessus subsp. abscessus]SIN02758.1 Biofilm regulator BssS [Mycobacteroides abscessus subsp. abscessus]SIN09926.1 Biofilm regulator BssS [Mycobacteroides abscessus subsp. abscessus]